MSKLWKVHTETNKHAWGSCIESSTSAHYWQESDMIYAAVQVILELLIECSFTLCVKDRRRPISSLSGGLSRQLIIWRPSESLTEINAPDLLSVSHTADFKPFNMSWKAQLNKNSAVWQETEGREGLKHSGRVFHVLSVLLFFIWQKYWG